MAEGKGTRLIPKNLTDSLGKLPPQVLDLEEAVLGALMIERPALAEVKDILKPEHFYTEAHKEIYNAILALASESASIDMRTVHHKLRSTGKIEIIGGVSYIAELTSKVSSAAAVREHSLVIIEMSLKRSMIVLASKIHTQAYEDDCDAFELLDKITSEFEFFKNHNLPKNNDDRIRELWKSTLLMEEPPEDVTLVHLGLSKTPVVVQKNHTLLIGKKKSRKTLFIALLIYYFLKAFPTSANKVLLFDTEQGRSHVWKLRKKIFQLSGLWVPIFYMRGMPPKERRDFISGTIKIWDTPPEIIVIDGIRDCMSNINDPDETTDVLVWLEQILTQHNVGIIEVLHLNKTDNNARGHIGSELLNKAVCTIVMELDEKNNCTTVKCESSRDQPFDTFSFTHDADALPVVIGVPMNGSVVTTDDKRARLDAIFEGQLLNYPDLIEGIKVHFDLGITRAKSLIAELQRQGYILKSGKTNNKNTVYKLLSGPIVQNPIQNVLFVAKPSENGHKTVKVEEKEYEPDDLPF